MVQMKKIVYLAALAAALALISCFDDDPVKTKNDDPDPISPYSGTFSITDTLDQNSCAVAAPIGAIVNIIVEGDSIYFGGFWGNWNEGTLTGAGISEEVTIPVDPPDCFSHYTVTFSITYTDADTFYGTYGSSFRKDPGCTNPDPCSFLYRIRGVR